MSNTCSIERLYDVYQEGPTKSRTLGAFFEHVFETVRAGRYGQYRRAVHTGPTAARNRGEEQEATW